MNAETKLAIAVAALAVLDHLRGIVFACVEIHSDGNGHRIAEIGEGCTRQPTLAGARIDLEPLGCDPPEDDRIVWNRRII